MEKLTIETTEGIVRGVRYCNQNGIDKDVAIVYLTILLKNHNYDESLVPFPIWIFGLKDIKKYLNYFNRFNLIFKSGNNYSISDFIKSEATYFSISNSQIVTSLINSTDEIVELNSYITAS